MILKVTQDFAPVAVSSFNAVRIKYPDRGERMETVFLKDEQEDENEEN